MASSELGSYVEAELDNLNIDTDPEVHSFRVPAASRASNLKTVRDAIATTLGKYWISRKRIRSDALRLLREDQL